jgi:two-component system response regulator YesN
LLHNNLLEFIHTKSVIGISRMKEGMKSWTEISQEANEAIRWSDVHKDHYVFYIDDFNQNPVIEDNNSYILSAVEYINHNFRQKGLKLQEIADIICLSSNYLSYLFKKIVGINLWDYVTKLRMEEAKRLILTTDMRRYEIADEIGYESPEHFGKIFKKYFGVNPSEFKN